MKELQENAVFREPIFEQEGPEKLQRRGRALVHWLMTRGDPEGLARRPGVWEGVGDRVHLGHRQDNIGVNAGPGWTAEPISRGLMGGAGKEIRPMLGSALEAPQGAQGLAEDP